MPHVSHSTLTDEILTHDQVTLLSGIKELEVETLTVEIALKLTELEVLKCYDLFESGKPTRKRRESQRERSAREGTWLSSDTLLVICSAVFSNLSFTSLKHLSIESPCKKFNTYLPKLTRLESLIIGPPGSQFLLNLCLSLSSLPLLTVLTLTIPASDFRARYIWIERELLLCFELIAASPVREFTWIDRPERSYLLLDDPTVQLTSKMLDILGSGNLTSLHIDTDDQSNKSSSARFALQSFTKEKSLRTLKIHYKCDGVSPLLCPSWFSRFSIPGYGVSFRETLPFLSGQGLSNLFSLTNLNTLDLTLVTGNDMRLSGVSQLTSLTSLKFHVSEGFQRLKYDPVWISCLPSSLVTLSLTCDLTVECYDSDSKLKTALYYPSPLARTFDQCLAHLQHLKALQSLTVNLSGQVTAKALEYLSPLSLKELTLGHAKHPPIVTLEVSSHTCEALSKCVSLRHLTVPSSSTEVFIETLKRVRSSLGTRFHVHVTPSES